MHNVRVADGQKSNPMDVFAGDPRSAETDLVIAAAFEGEASTLVTRWSDANRRRDRSRHRFEGIQRQALRDVHHADRGPRVSRSTACCSRAWRAERIHGGPRPPGGDGDRSDGPAQEDCARGVSCAWRARHAGDRSSHCRGVDARAVRGRTLQNGGLRSVRADGARHRRRGANALVSRACGAPRDASSAGTATSRGSSTTSLATR